MPKGARSLPKISGETGLPVLKKLVQKRSLLAGLEAMHRELGDAFQISMPGFSASVLANPKSNRQILVEKRDNFLWRNESDPVTRLLRQGVLVVDGPQHDSLRAKMEPALHRSQVRNQIEIMWRCTDAITANWEEGGVQDMLVEMRRVALLILMRSMFSVNFEADMDRLWDAILRVLEYISPGLWLILPKVPRPQYLGAIQDLDNYLYRIIRTRRRNDLKDDDLLGRLVSEPEMSDALVRDQILTMMIAGHDTSTALFAWVLFLLGTHPEAMKRAKEEVDSVLGRGAPAPEHLRRLRYLDQVIKETLRLYPPIHVGNRVAANDMQIGGYQVQEGARVMLSIYLSHRDEKIWPQADQFLPERFDLEVGQSQTPFSYLPFGGGPRNCIGAAFAQVEAKVVLARVLQTFDLTLVSNDVHTHMGATLEPRPGVSMRVSRRQSSA